MDSLGGSVAASRRLHSSKPPAPPPPQKVRKCDPAEVEVQEEDGPRIFSVSNHRGLLKPSQEQTKEPQGLTVRKLDDQNLEHDLRGGSQTKPVEEQKVPLAHRGETLLATFYGMLYANDGAEKEWKLEVDGFIPVCFVQVHGNANKPFRIIAVEKSKRIMEYQVTGTTTCARNSSFVRWQDGAVMFGVRFAKEDQAEKFFSTVKRMASTLAKAVQLLKQPERKAVIRKMSDPASSGNIHHTKVSLMIKLPDKQTTIMSVPGLLTMSELFEMICEKEHLSAAEHQLCLPRTGARKVTFDSGTAVGSLKIREVAIIRTILSDNSTGSVEMEDESLEDLLDIEGEENKILHIVLPTGIRKSYRVSLDMTMKQLVMRVCSRESLNPRHHSLQYIDFKHEFLDMASTVDEIGVNQVRLMDKRGRNISRPSISDEYSPSNCPINKQFRKSSESDIASEDKENRMSWQRSKSMDVLSDDRDCDVFMQQDLPKQSVVNGSVPTSTRRNSCDGITSKKPPVPPMPYGTKSASLPKKPPRDLANGGLKDQSFSPIKKEGIISASTPDLSLSSSKSDDSPGTNSIKTSTPDTKSRRRVAPPPPPRPAVPKALFTEGKPATQANGLPVKTPTPAARTTPSQAPTVNPTPMLRSNTSQAPPAIDAKVKPRVKKRPAPPRPVRPPPPQTARQSSTESKDSKGSEDGSDRKRAVNTQFKQDMEVTSLDRASLSLDIEPPSYDYQDKGGEEDDWRGAPIFIPPPPPDELPPPLDECETPVGPLTDYEAGILEGSTNFNFPVTVNGFVDMAKYLAPSQVQSIPVEQMQTESDDRNTELRHAMLRSKQDTVLATVAEHPSFPVVPPPPLYSESPEILSNKNEPVFTSQALVNEPSSPGLTNIPPPLLETEATSTSQDAEEKDHDSGFDQSPEVLIVTPPVGPSDDVPERSWEDPDSGSSLDVSAIPPPVDFATTRPLTPPCQFANATEAPPEGYVEDDKKVQEPEEAKPRKKLNINEALFPWMNEPQAPLDATVPLAVPEGMVKDPALEMVNSEREQQVGENVQKRLSGEGYSGTITRTASGVVVVPITGSSVSHEFENQTAKKPLQLQLKTRQDNVLEDKHGKSIVPVVEDTRVELPRRLSDDQNKESVVAQKMDTLESNKIGTDKNAVINDNSNSVLQQGSGTIAKPEPKAKPITFVKEAEVKIEPNVGVQQSAPSSLYQSTEVTKPELHVEPVKLEPQVKFEKPETQAKPATFVKEGDVKVEAYTPSSFNVSTDSARQQPQVEPVKLEPPVKPEKPETQAKPVKIVKEPQVEIGVKHNVPSSFIPSIEAVKTEPQVEANTPASFISSVEAARPDQQVVALAKQEAQVNPAQPETRAEPVTFVKEEPKVDVQQPVPSSFTPSADVTRVEPRLEHEKPELQVKPEKPEKLQSRAVEEVVTPQLNPEVEASVNILVKEQAGLSDSSSRDVFEVNSGNTVPCQEAFVTIVSVGEESVVVEAPVTPETKPTPSSHDRLRDLEERLQELDKETVPTSCNVRKPDTTTAPKTHQDEPAFLRKDPLAEDVIVAETKHVEFSSYNQLEELLKLDRKEEKPTKEVTGVVNKDVADAVVERQRSQLESFTDVDSEMRLDLSSLRQSPEPPRPPSSSPPATTPRSTILPSPRELLSDRSSESGISLLEEPKSLSNSVDPNGDTDIVQGDASHTGEKPTSSKPHTGEKPTRSKPHIGEKPTNVSAKLQRPLSMPTGIPRDFKSESVEEKKQSVTESDSRKSSSSDSTGVSSSSLPSSPVESGSTTEPGDLPKPPPFTVPPLRRYSDLASDLSFISSAAKAAEKSHESETKTEPPPKPANLVLKRSSVSVVERPRSWMGPETNNNNNKKQTMWSSVFKPVSFEAQGKKAVRPVVFDAKSFTAPSIATTAPSATKVNSGDASTAERKSSPVELDTSSKKAPLVRETSLGKSTAPVSSPFVKEQASSIHQPTSTGVSSNPTLKKTEPQEKKYEIIYSNNSSEAQDTSKDHPGKTGITGIGSHGPSKDLSSSASIRDQIMRDSTGGKRATRAIPQSAFVGGSKFQILPADKKPSSSTGASWADVKKLAALQSKRQPNEPSKPDVPHTAAEPPQPVKAVDVKPQPMKAVDIKPQAMKTVDIKPQPMKTADVKPQPMKTADIKPQPVKAPAIQPQPDKAADSKPLPAVVMRITTASQDPTKRHSMPTYIIEGADRKPTPKTNSSGGQFHFNVVKEVQTDTTVVPQGVVAAMKALREKKGITEGDGEVDLEHTQWV